MRFVNMLKATAFGPAYLCGRTERTAASRFSLCLALLGGFALTAATNPALADSFTGYIYNSQLAQQTSDSAPVAADLHYFSAGAYFDNPGNYASGSVTYPGAGSPQALTPNSTSLDFSSGYYASQSALHTDYPFGTYTVTASGGTQGTATSAISYSTDYFTNTIPYVTNFSSLNGLNPATDFTFNFNSFVPDPNVSEGYTFFRIFDTLGNLVFSIDFLDPSAMSALLPGGTLDPGSTYVFELDFSNRLDNYLGFDSDTGTDIWSTQGSDFLTYGYFDTAAQTPLPGTWLLMVSGLSGLAAIRFRNKNAAAVAAN